MSGILREALVERMREGWEPFVEGSYIINVHEPEDDFAVSICQAGIELENVSEAPDGSFTFSEDGVKRFIETTQLSSWQLGQCIEYDGGYQPMVEFAMLLLRPQPGTAEALARADTHDAKRAASASLTRMSGFDEEAALEHLRDNRPILFRDLDTSTGEYDWDRFIAEFGGEELHFRVGNLRVTVEEAYEKLRQGEQYYSNGVGTPAALANLMRPPTIAGQSFANEPLWWLGGLDEELLTPLHRDPGPNMLRVLLGEKTIHLYRPTDTRYLYPRSISYDYNQQFWARTPESATARGLKEVSKATPIRIDLKPGDLLLIPTGWGHMVHASGSSISFTYPLNEEWCQANGVV